MFAQLTFLLAKYYCVDFFFHFAVWIRRPTTTMNEISPDLPAVWAFIILRSITVSIRKTSTGCIIFAIKILEFPTISNWATTVGRDCSHISEILYIITEILFTFYMGFHFGGHTYEWKIRDFLLHWTEQNQLITFVLSIWAWLDPWFISDSKFFGDSYRIARWLNNMYGRNWLTRDPDSNL